MPVLTIWFQYRKDILLKPGYATLMKQFTHVDPYQCVLCGERMVFSSAEVGSRAEVLLAQRREKLEKKRWLLAA
jgi:hypothetical protein|uniref:hypothetical protein n=1 Tax=Hafnia alvei TaxID=569 RepID=UPI00187D4A3D|nr:hypothetical protein [Hafnia alvei]